VCIATTGEQRRVAATTRLRLVWRAPSPKLLQLPPQPPSFACYGDASEAAPAYVVYTDGTAKRRLPVHRFRCCCCCCCVLGAPAHPQPTAVFAPLLCPCNRPLFSRTRAPDADCCFRAPVTLPTTAAFKPPRPLPPADRCFHDNAHTPPTIAFDASCCFCRSAFSVRRSAFNVQR
jgi:hypothetical protein